MRSRLFATLLLLLASSLPAADYEALPPVATDEQKLKYLLHIHEQVPNIFDDATKYEIDLFSILEKQAEIQLQLKANPEFKKLQAQRGNRVRIEVQPGTPGATADFSAEATRQLKAALARESIVPSTFHQELKALSQELAQVSSNAFLTGLIKTLPKEKQGEAFKLSLDEKMKLFSTSLPDELVDAGFVAKNFGITASRFSREEALDRLKEILGKEGSLRARLMVAALVMDEQGRVPPDWKEALQKLRIGEIGKRLEKGTLQGTLARLAEGVGESGNRKLQGGWDQSLAAAAKDLREKTPAPTPATVASSLTLEEVSPHTGIFRGCVGGDCSTSYSFPYSNSPNERVFFIRGKDGKVKGYLAGTHVDVKYVPTFYLHTISGPNLSTQDARTAIQAIHEARDLLNVRQVALPTPERVGMLVNFEPIIHGMNEMAAQAPVQPLHYLDQPVRKMLTPFAEKAQYDGVEFTQEVRVYHGTEAAPLTQTKASEIPSIPFKDRPIVKKEVVKIGLGMIHIGKTEHLEKFLRPAGLDTDEIARLKELFKNTQGLPVAEFHRKVANELLRHGIDFEEIASQKPHFLTLGRLRSDDAFASAERAKTLELIAATVDDPRVVNGLSGVITPNRPTQDILDVLQFLESKSKKSGDTAIIHLLSDPMWNRDERAVRILQGVVDRGHADAAVLSNLYLPWKERADLIKRWAGQILVRGNADTDLVKYYSFLIENEEELRAFLKPLLQRGKADAAIAEYIFDQPLFMKLQEAPELFEELLSRNQADMGLARMINHSPYAEHPSWRKWLDTLLERGNADSELAQKVRTMRLNEEEKLSIARKLLARGNADSHLLESYVAYLNPKTTPAALELYDQIVKRGAMDHAYFTVPFSRAHWIESAEGLKRFEQLLDRSELHQALAWILAKPQLQANPKLNSYLDRIFDPLKPHPMRAEVDSFFVLNYLEAVTPQNMPKAIEIMDGIVARGYADQQVARLIEEGRAWNSLHEKEVWLSKIERRKTVLSGNPSCSHMFIRL